MDAGADAGPGQGDGGQGDGGAGDGGSGEKEQKGDGGASQQNEPADGGSDGGAEDQDGGTPQEAKAQLLPDGGIDVNRKDAEKLLDSLKSNEKNLQLWRFKQKSKKSETNGKDW